MPKPENGLKAHHQARIYVVEPTNERTLPRPHLVRATHPSHALAHVAQSMFDVRFAEQEDLEKYLGDGGLRIERYVPRRERKDEDPEPPPVVERQRQER